MAQDEIESMVDEATDTAIGDGAPVGEATETGGPLDGADATTEPAAPVADAWKPPSREEWEAAQKHAEIGREFAPHANHIRDAFRRGFQPAAETAPKARPADAPAADDYDTYFGTPKAYEDWKAAVKDDPAAFQKGVAAAARRALKSELARIQAQHEYLSKLEPQMNELYGFAATAGQRFQETPKWAQFGKAALELVNGGKVMDLESAFELAERRAKASGATPKQAAQAGAGAAQAQAKQNIQAGSNAKGTRPVPRAEPSLRPGAARAGAIAPVQGGRMQPGKAGKYEHDLVMAALRKNGVK